MQDRKSHDRSTHSTNQAAVMHDRRMNEVRRNFAIGSKRETSTPCGMAQPRTRRNVKV